MSNPLQPGIKLKKDRYEIKQHLKSGGFGAVYVATDAKFGGLPCVIKESFGQSQADSEQFEQEADILFTLSHPHLVRVTDRFSEPTQAQYLVMEYIEGEDLEEILKRYPGGLPEADVLVWTDQVLEALACCHAFTRPVIHRDIKPSNIRIRRSDGKAILVDFGIAKISDPTGKTHQGARGATHGYSPVEQYAGTGTGPYSDIYALGATLYHLLTGIEPPAAPSMQAGTATLPPPRSLRPAISAQTERVILTAMQTKVQDRYQTVLEMRQDLKGRLPTALCPHCGAPVRKSAHFCSLCSLVQVVQPLVFPQTKIKVSTVAELVTACEQQWTEACTLLRQGVIETWLGSINAKLLEQSARDARTGSGNDMNSALEIVLSVAAPARTKPMLSVLSAALDFGLVKRGDVKMLNLVIANGGRGYLHGTVSADPPTWLAVTPNQFGCLAGVQQGLQVEVKTAALTGTASGASSTGRILIQSNRGRQTVDVKLAVVEAPEVKLNVAAVDFGKVGHGATAHQSLEISNGGGGILHSRVRVTEAWLMLVDSAGKPLGSVQRTLPDMGPSQATTVNLALDLGHLQRRGRFGATVLIEASSAAVHTLLATVPVSVTIEPPYRLDPADASTGVATLDQLSRWCDANWTEALALFGTGQLDACLAFLGEAPLVQAAALARRHGHASIGLESLLRACGAPSPQRWRSNDDEVVAQLGFGIMPWLFGRKSVVVLRITNQSQRGYLHGLVMAQAPWLTIPAPAFGCLPGQVAEVELHVDPSARRWRFSFDEALYEIVVGQ